MNALVTPALTPSQEALSAFAFIPSMASVARVSSFFAISDQSSTAAFNFATGASMMSSYVSMVRAPRALFHVVRQHGRPHEIPSIFTSSLACCALL